MYNFANKKGKLCFSLYILIETTSIFSFEFCGFYLNCFGLFCFCRFLHLVFTLLHFVHKMLYGLNTCCMSLAYSQNIAKESCIGIFFYISFLYENFIKLFLWSWKLMFFIYTEMSFVNFVNVSFKKLYLSNRGGQLLKIIVRFGVQQDIWC